MLLEKYWLETKYRFFIGVLFITALCMFFVLMQPWILEQWALEEKLDPNLYNPPWLLIARTDFTYFIWHFLHNNLLQLTWAILTVMLALGGVQHESENGSALFTLSLPVSRKKIFMNRVWVGFLEASVLALLPVVVIPFLSWCIGLEYNVITGLSHSLLFIVGGTVFYAIGVLINSLIKGETISFFLAVSLVFVFYFLFQPYSDGMHKPFLVKMIDLPGFIAGTSEANTVSDPGIAGGLSCMAISGLLIYLSYFITLKRDF